eukprot:1900201-Amphidinium_carterae.1
MLVAARVRLSRQLSLHFQHAPFESKAAAAEATALVQQKGKVHLKQEPPPIFDAPYQGLGAESGGVLGLLQVAGSLCQKHASVSFFIVDCWIP